MEDLAPSSPSYYSPLPQLCLTIISRLFTSCTLLLPYAIILGDSTPTSWSPSHPCDSHPWQAYLSFLLLPTSATHYQDHTLVFVALLMQYFFKHVLLCLQLSQLYNIPYSPLQILRPTSGPPTHQPHHFSLFMTCFVSSIPFLLFFRFNGQSL